MKLIDKNESWLPPVGYDLSKITAEGAFLRLDYYASLPNSNGGEKHIVVFVNDMGREVMRAIETYFPPTPVPTLVPHSTSLSRRRLLWNAVKRFLHDIREIFS